VLSLVDTTDEPSFRLLLVLVVAVLFLPTPPVSFLLLWLLKLTFRVSGGGSLLWLDPILVVSLVSTLAIFGFLFPCPRSRLERDDPREDGILVTRRLACVNYMLVVAVAVAVGYLVF